MCTLLNTFPLNYLIGVIVFKDKSSPSRQMGNIIEDEMKPLDESHLINDSLSKIAINNDYFIRYEVLLENILLM